MSCPDRAGFEDDPDTFLSLLEVPEDCHSALADMETILFQFSPPPTNPQPLHQNYPRTPDLPFPGGVVVQDIILPDTPLEPYGPQESYTGCLAGLEECDAWSSLGNEDTVFRFPAISDLSASSTPQNMALMPSLVPPGFDEASCMDTPPDTPTDPHSLFDGFSSQRPSLGPCPSSSSGPFLSLLTAPPQPPSRQRLQGTSLMEDGDLQDLDILEDLSVFSDSEMPAPDHTDTSSECFQQSEAEGDQEPTPAVQAGECVDPPARQERKGLRLKQVLRQKIIQNRLDNGQGELKVDFTEGPVYQMTEQDEARRNVRRAQNRGAAQRFRQRKKLKEQEMRRECEEKRQTNSCLKREVKQLRAEVARLEAVLRQHRHCGLGGWDRPPPLAPASSGHDLPRTAVIPPSSSLDVLGGDPTPHVLP